MYTFEKDLFVQDKKYSVYVPEENDQIKVNHVMRRFNEMYQQRLEVQKKWVLYQTMINANFAPYPDERSSSIVPLASAMIELYVAEALKIQPQYNFRAENSKYKTNARALEHAWKYDWRKNNRKKAFTESEYICWWFWDTVIYVWFESLIIKQTDIIINSNWDIEYKDTEIKDEKIIVDHVDIRDFYLDNSAVRGIEDANDCILIQWMPYKRFTNFQGNKQYKNIEYVKPIPYSNEYRPFIMPEEVVKIWEFVKLAYYWNKDIDCLLIVANWVLVREQPIPSTINWRKALPFVIRWMWYKNYSIYHRWLCEWLMMFNTEINNLREMLMDWIRRSNANVVAIWNWLTFNGRSFAFDNEILEFNWNLRENFQQISWTPPNQAIFQYKESLFKDIAMYIWIDIQNILWEPQQTAYQTEVQREWSQKRVNVWLTNRDLALERFADLYKDALQTYFPRQTAEWVFPEIEIEWEQLQWDKFVKKQWKSIFQVTPEILRWDIYVDVYTNTNAPTINAVDRQLKMEFFTWIQNIIQWYAVAKQNWFDLENIFPLKKTLQDLADDSNIETDWWIDDWVVQDKKKEVYNQFLQMMNWMWWQTWTEWQQNSQQQTNTQQQNNISQVISPTNLNPTK